MDDVLASISAQARAETAERALANLLARETFRPSSATTAEAGTQTDHGAPPVPSEHCRSELPTVAAGRPEASDANLLPADEDYSQPPAVTARDATLTEFLAMAAAAKRWLPFVFQLASPLLMLCDSQDSGALLPPLPPEPGVGNSGSSDVLGSDDSDGSGAGSSDGDEKSRDDTSSQSSLCWCPCWSWLLCDYNQLQVRRWCCQIRSMDRPK